MDDLGYHRTAELFQKGAGVHLGRLLPPRTDLIQTANLAEAMAGGRAARELVHPTCHGNPGNWHAWLLGGYWHGLRPGAPLIDQAEGIGGCVRAAVGCEPAGCSLAHFRMHVRMA